MCLPACSMGLSYNTQAPPPFSRGAAGFTSCPKLLLSTVEQLTCSTPEAAAPWGWKKSNSGLYSTAGQQMQCKHGAWCQNCWKRSWVAKGSLEGDEKKEAAVQGNIHTTYKTKPFKGRASSSLTGSSLLQKARDTFIPCPLSCFKPAGWLGPGQPRWFSSLCTRLTRSSSETFRIIRNRHSQGCGQMNTT